MAFRAACSSRRCLDESGGCEDCSIWLATMRMTPGRWRAASPVIDEGALVLENPAPRRSNGKLDPVTAGKFPRSLTSSKKEHLDGRR
jgi:hypothetical protein